MEMRLEEVQMVNRMKDRRGFLKGVGLTGLGVAAGGAMLASAKPAQSQSSPINGLTSTDVTILNFALNLEYLEAEFYSVTLLGKTLEELGIGTDGVGTAGPTTGGARVNFDDLAGFTDQTAERSGRLRTLAQQVTLDEQNHVLVLRSLLGSQAIAKPAINLNAKGTDFANFKSYLSLARSFEDVGSSAYGGAAPLLSPTALSTAARIALVEAMHASALRLVCAEDDVLSPPVDALDFPPPPVGSKYFSVDSQSLGVVRTTSQVLAIVLGNATPGTSSGGFFPAGLNGGITTV